MTFTKQHLGLVIAVALVGGAIFYLNGLKPARMPSPTSKGIGSALSGHTPAPDISTPDGFVNVDKISLADLTGKKVVLVDFWTYSCINCQRTLPYLNAWYDKYKDQGLEIIGVHTPEFEFEKEYDNVKKAVERFNINYPVVLDNDFSTWDAYGNRYWPRKYLVDIHGDIVYDHIGEGGYEETEQQIQALLEQRATFLGEKMDIASGEVKPEDAVTEMLGTRSPEIYFGAGRNDQYIGAGDGGRVGVQTFTAPTMALADDKFYLVGTWDMQPEYAQGKDAGHILFRYRAMNVYFVGSSDQPLTVRVLRDGKLLTNDLAGADVRDGVVTIGDERLYHLIKEGEGSEHRLDLEISGPGLKAFTFTFG